MIPPEIERRLANIRSGLLRLREADPQLLFHGAGEHRYLLNSPATAQSLEAFEKARRIALPQEYPTGRFLGKDFYAGWFTISFT